MCLHRVGVGLPASIAWELVGALCRIYGVPGNAGGCLKRTPQTTVRKYILGTTFGILHSKATPRPKQWLSALFSFWPNLLKCHPLLVLVGNTWRVTFPKQLAKFKSSGCQQGLEGLRSSRAQTGPLQCGAPLPWVSCKGPWGAARGGLQG